MCCVAQPQLQTALRMTLRSISDCSCSEVRWQTLGGGRNSTIYRCIKASLDDSTVESPQAHRVADAALKVLIGSLTKFEVLLKRNRGLFEETCENFDARCCLTGVRSFDTMASARSQNTLSSVTACRTSARWRATCRCTCLTQQSAVQYTCKATDNTEQHR